MQQKADSYYKMKRNMIWNKYNSKCSGVSTKWMDVFIKYLVPLWTVFVPLLGFVNLFFISDQRHSIYYANCKICLYNYNVLLS